MCTNKNENERRFAQARTTHNPEQLHEIQNKKCINRICVMNSDTREPSKLYREFEQLTFDAVQQQSDNKTEIFTELQIRLPDRPGTHTLKAKVDTGAEGNMLPLWTYRRMFPDKVHDLGQPILGSTKKELTILTVYNGSSIMQHGSVCIQCAHKGKWTTLEFFVLTTEGPTIIGLLSLRNLELISLHCTIKDDKGPIDSIVELTNSYPNQFERIGHFKSDYHIALKPDHNLVIHAPRKCPIHLRDGIKEEWKTMEF